jgi:hypothetical protein
MTEFPWYKSLEAIDAANWPLWLISGILGLIILGMIAFAVHKITEDSRDSD